MSDFRPLFPTRIPSNKPERAETRAWYEVVERFPVVEEPQEDDTSVSEDGEGVSRAFFGSIDAVMENEARKRRKGDSEPADVLKLRMDAGDTARRLVAEARQQGELILEECRAQGHKLGYEAGYAAGAQDAARHLAQRAEDQRRDYEADLTAFIASVEGSSRQAWLAMEPEILGLVFEIARKVIKMEVELNREPAVEIVKNTLRRVADSTSLRIRVHADDLETVRANREDLYNLVDSIRKVEIVEDRRVGPGGCIVETDAGTIDARIETQLEEIRKLMGQAMTAQGD